MRPVNVLVIDDDPSIRKLLSELLQGRPEYRVLIAGSGQEAVRCFAEEKVDVVLTDIHMPGFTGLELMADMQKIKFKPEILVMTANATPENVETARQVGARSVILKPFDNLDVVEAEIEKAARVAAARGNGGSAAAPAAPARAPAPTPPPAARTARPAAPPAAPPARPARAAPAATPPPPRSTPAPATGPAAIPEFDAWKGALVGNETPQGGGSGPGQDDGAILIEDEPERPPAPAPRPAVTRGPAPRVGPPAGAPRVAAPARPPAASASASPPASSPPAPVAASPPPAAVQGQEIPSGLPLDQIPGIPGELVDLFRTAENLEGGRMKVQVPIICVQTREESQVVAVLRQVAASLQREFYTWSASKGIVKGDGNAMGEMYREPSRALEFIHRQKSRGLYVLADFRQCLEDLMVARALREMVMEMQTSTALLVLTAPRMPIPPELEADCVVLDWPAGIELDAGALFEEVRAEIQASTNRPVRLDAASRAALLDRVRQMPAGRARFEIARALLAAGKHEP